MAKRLSKRATRGGERQSTEAREIAFAHRARNGPCDRCGQGGLVFLALAGPAVCRLGDSAPRWPAGSPAQWQRPQMRGCVIWRDRATKSSRGRLFIAKTKAAARFRPWNYRGTKTINEKTNQDRGCPPCTPRGVRRFLGKNHATVPVPAAAVAHPRSRVLISGPRGICVTKQSRASSSR